MESFKNCLHKLYIGYIIKYIIVAQKESDGFSSE